VTAARPAPHRDGAAAAGHEDIEIDGRVVALTAPDALVFAGAGVTKRALVEHYVDVAPWMTPHVAGLRAHVQRWPRGAGGGFSFLKRAPVGAPEWLRFTHDGAGFAIELDGAAAIAWAVEHGAIEIAATTAAPARGPKLVLLDLEPGEGTPMSAACEAALAARASLEALGLVAFVKTSGSRGLHVAAPVGRTAAAADVDRFTRATAAALAARSPHVFSAERARGRVCVAAVPLGRAIASPWSARAVPRATVSTPVAWSEIARGVDTQDFVVGASRARLARLGDPWSAILDEASACDLARVL
jgi:bifunctional non-homologous end joining protein LigD